MSDRDKILERVQRHLPPETPLPEMPAELIHFDDPVQQFLTLLESVGGTGVRVENDEALAADVAERFADFEEIWSGISGVASKGEIAQTADDRPGEWHRLQLALCAGHFGVAENAAIWMDLSTLPHPSLLALSEHLAIRLPREALVQHMHEAYQRIDPGNLDAYHVFVSGPSKTADIEQSLVIGAHGARSLVVYLVG